MPLSEIQKKKKMQEYQEARAMYLRGIPLRQIGKAFGKSHEWANIVVKGSGAAVPFKALQNHLDLTKRSLVEGDEQPR
jgi:transposase-like protein